MPTSQPRTLTPVHTIIQSLEPRSVIDIGVGHGKTGVILREYLEIMKGRYKPEAWRTKVYGIEAFPAYRNPLWEYAYDSVVIRDALEGLQELPDVDLILALDVWEHFKPSYASMMLDTCLKKARYLLICTPKDPLSQGSVFDNPHERHVSRWSPRDFLDIPYRLVTGTTHDWILVLSSCDPLPAPLRRLGNPMFTLLRDFRRALSWWVHIIRSRS